MPETDETSIHVDASSIQGLDVCDSLHTNGTIERCYLSLEIGGHTVRALVDSGASSTFIGSIGLELARDFDLSFRPPSVARVRFDDGTLREITGEIVLPVNIGEVSVKTVCYVVPELSPNLVFGMNFLDSAGIVVDYANRRWGLSKEPGCWYPFCREDGTDLGATVSRY